MTTARPYHGGRWYALDHRAMVDDSEGALSVNRRVVEGRMEV